MVSVYEKLEDEVVDECYKLLDLCLQVFSKDSQDRLHKVNLRLVDTVGNLLFDFALYDFAKSKNMFESLLQFGERMVRVIRKQIGDKSCASITHHILERLSWNELSWRSSTDREKKGRVHVPPKASERESYEALDLKDGAM